LERDARFGLDTRPQFSRGHAARNGVFGHAAARHLPGAPVYAMRAAAVVSKILLVAALVLLGLKFGLRQRLREIARAIDGIVNVLLVLIVVSYLIQLIYLWLKD
jgi:hypothetical protein